jgi:hypothetical protein
MKRLRLAAALALGAACAVGPAHAGGLTAEEQAAEAQRAPRAAQKPAAKSKPRAKPPPLQAAPAVDPPRAEVIAAPEPKRQLAVDETVPILGRRVLGANNEELGRVVNVLVDNTGRARAAVIDFGGFLGVGSRKIAVDWGQLVFKPASPERSIGLTMTREQIQGAAEFRENAPRPVEVVVPKDPARAPERPEGGSGARPQ